MYKYIYTWAYRDDYRRKYLVRQIIGEILFLLFLLLFMKNGQYLRTALPKSANDHEETESTEHLRNTSFKGGIRVLRVFVYERGNFMRGVSSVFIVDCIAAVCHLIFTSIFRKCTTI
jgi:hypothetical protein